MALPPDLPCFLCFSAIEMAFCFVPEPLHPEIHGAVETATTTGVSTECVSSILKTLFSLLERTDRIFHLESIQRAFAGKGCCNFCRQRLQRHYSNWARGEQDEKNYWLTVLLQREQNVPSYCFCSITKSRSLKGKITVSTGKGKWLYFCVLVEGWGSAYHSDWCIRENSPFDFHRQLLNPNLHQGFWEGRRDKHYLLQAEGKQWSSKSRISQTSNREKNPLLLNHVVWKVLCWQLGF